MKNENITFLAVRELFCFKQDYFGLLVGMGKTAISRLENGKRKETLEHKEALNMLTFLKEKGLVDEYVYWRFGLKVTRRFYIKW